MTKEEAESQLGKIIFQGTNKVVRAKQDEELLTIYVHIIRNGAEQRPLGYLIGDNIFFVKDVL